MILALLMLSLNQDPGVSGFTRQLPPDGIYEVLGGSSPAPGTGTDPKALKFFSIVRDGNGVTVRDLESGGEYRARVNTDGNLVVNVAGGSPLAIRLSDATDKASAPAAATSGAAGIVAVRLISLWRCSNHDAPTHIAKSEDEMREKTSKHSCIGWRKLSADK